MVLKMVSSLMADWNVVSNPEFFMLFRTSSHIFSVKNISECAISYSLSTSECKTEASVNEIIPLMRSGEKTFKSLNNSIKKRRCEIFQWTEIESCLFLKVPCKLIYEVYFICCLLICRYRNKDNFAYRYFLWDKTTPKRSVMHDT